MTKKMLVDAKHEEELRLVIFNAESQKVEDLECEVASKRSLKGNVYLARVARVEPSLQAAFLDLGDDRQGFLAFNEIHPDYYRIPVEDQKKLLQTLSEEMEREDSLPEEGEEIEEEADVVEPAARTNARSKILRKYRIQEVISKRQLMLVRVVKDERGVKKPALTTYLSFPGRYCVLMPNTPKGGGISRKIVDKKQRERLKKVMDSFSIPEGMGLILRTAGQGRTKNEIKRDFDYLLNLWEGIREKNASLHSAHLYLQGINTC
jgi:ribonuclease E